MAPPPQQPCTVPGCDYITPENIPTWELVIKQQEIHLKSKHANHAGNEGGGGQKGKLDKKVRPSITPQMTEESWRFIIDEWSRYKRQTGITGQQLLDELWSCMNEELRQLAFNEGGSDNLTTEADLLKRIKKLAVVTLHPSVHVVSLHELRQQSDENTQTFAAKVRGVAASCGLSKKCPGCQQVVSFSDETCYHQVLAGLSDQSMKERALTQAMMGTITDLDSLVKWCTADEAGRLPTQGMTLGRIQSTFKKLQNKKCKNCGAPVHGDGSKSAREQECKAFGKTCSRCQKKDHFAAVCKSSPAKNSAIKEEEPPPVGAQNSLDLFAVTEIDTSSQIWRPWEPTSLPTSCPPVSCSREPAPPPCYAIPTQNRFAPLLQDQDEPELDIRDSGGKLYATSRPHQKALRYPVVTPTQLEEVPVANVWESEIPTQPLQLAGVVKRLRAAEVGSIRTVKLPHVLHTIHDGWLQSPPKKSPMLSLDIKLHQKSYKELGLDVPSHVKKPCYPNTSILTPCIMDTGAQMSLAPLSLLAKMGINQDTTFPLQSRVAGASAEPIQLLGGIIVEITGTTPSGATNSCLQLLYISNAVKEIYMSLDACIQLGVVSKNFPEVSDINQVASLVNTPEEGGHGQCTNTGVVLPEDTPCSCPNRTLPPKDKPSLPCPPTEENLPILKKYILDRYASSAFNTCERRPLPLMNGSPPLKLFVDPKATPIAAHKPAVVPLHWKEPVKGGLDRDERLGVIKKVDVNTPIKWCSRMVVTPKPNSNEPRRVIDYSAVNLHAPRQTHAAPSPWSLVSSIPPNQYKTVLDNWHGYHSVEVAEEDRHYTTFNTEWGLYQYVTVPQGFTSAGDGYNHRMDIITSEVPRMKKCVDDSLLYDTSIQEQFFRVCEYLELCSNHGIIFNPKKFQFSAPTVQYLGFEVTMDGIKPTQTFLENIRTFPTPRNITDVRSWFGCIAQISFAFSTSTVMAPFRHLLSSKAQFQWTRELEEAFQASKEEIIRQCIQGVQSFDVNLPTALATDWSKLGIAFWLCQKKCKCAGPPMPGCCQSGWQTVLCGSRFCSPAESRYCPIEGEGLACTWGLDKCKFYLLGMKDFTLAIDHNPLVHIFGQQAVQDIPNPRLTSQKIKTMMYSFTPYHVPGKNNVVPDCFSRRSDSPIPPTTSKSQNLLDTSNILPGYDEHLGPPSWVTTGRAGALHGQDLDDTDTVELLLLGLGMAAIAEINNAKSCPVAAATSLVPNQSSDKPVLLTWARLEKAAINCKSYQTLHSLISSGAPDDRSAWPESLLQYYQHRHSLLTVGCIVYLHDRPVIPEQLRAEVLLHLHAGHSAVTAMYARATSCMYWPNMRDDIVKMRASCASCNLIAPSNPSCPPHPVCHPAYPFSDICADFFQYSGKSYLVVVDRYSNWLSIFHLPTDTSAEIIKILRRYCMTWGVPESISTDGASNFTSTEIEDWLRRWGIHHRVSSHYYPRSNKRAEVSVKSSKRMIMNNLGPNGSLDSDKIARAALLHRNCPDPLTGLSPAQVIFGRVLRDHLPLQPGHFSVRAEWRQNAERRENALAHRHVIKHEALTSGSRKLPPLKLGDKVMVQDQSTHKPGRWTKTGTVVEVQEYDSYLVKIDGSNTVTKRNRKFLRKVVTYNEVMNGPAPDVSTATLPMPSPTNTLPPDHHSSHDAPPQASVTTGPASSHETSLNPPPRSQAQPQVPKVKLKKNKTQWVIVNKEPNPDHSKPPSPGIKHDYQAMELESQRQREAVRASRRY